LLAQDKRAEKGIRPDRRYRRNYLPGYCTNSTDSVSEEAGRAGRRRGLRFARARNARLVAKGSRLGSSLTES
jgi:hypothetical protein